jgi:hypothetical protein
MNSMMFAAFVIVSLQLKLVTDSRAGVNRLLACREFAAIAIAIEPKALRD